MTKHSPHFKIAELDSASFGTNSNGAVAVKTKTVRAKQSGSKKLFNLSDRTNSLLGIQIVGSGAYVPDNVVTNHDLKLSMVLNRAGLSNVQAYFKDVTLLQRWQPATSVQKLQKKQCKMLA